MRITSLLFIATLFISLSCDTTNSVDPVFEKQFIKYYGEDGNQMGVDMVVNADGSMVLLGNTTLTSLVTFPFIVKIDPLGNVIWQRRMGGQDERAADVELDRQGNLIVVSNIGDALNSRIRLFRIDQQGNGLDSLLIDMGEWQIAKSVTQASDNSFLIAGYAEAKVVRNPELIIPPFDEADIIVLQVDEALLGASLFLGQGGEHVGSAVKIFEALLGGDTKYLVFGDSDRPIDDITYKRAFEVISVNLDGVQGIRQVSSIDNEIQIAATTIETRGALQEGYLMVGTSYVVNNATSEVYITQYDKDLTIKRLDKKLSGLQRRLEGVSAAVGDLDDFYIVADEITANNKHDIVLLRMANDGVVLGLNVFGTLEGDDMAAAVSVLPDRRPALLGTIELETQRKMALMIISPEGKFSN